MATMNRRPAVGRHFARAIAIALFAAITIGALAGIAEAKTSDRCKATVSWLNYASNRLVNARAAGDTSSVTFWQREFDISHSEAASQCGWGDS
jgi:hypothetical protein